MFGSGSDCARRSSSSRAGSHDICRSSSHQKEASRPGELTIRLLECGCPGFISQEAGGERGVFHGALTGAGLIFSLGAGNEEFVYIYEKR